MIPQPARKPTPRLMATLLAAAATLSGCVVGPNYSRPSVETPAAFKEAPNAANGWVPTQPMDAIDRGAWWAVFNDPILDGLEKRVAVSNQNVAQSAAAYRQARALTDADRAGFFPSVSASGSANRSGGGGSTPSLTRYSASIGASWAPDVWGRLRRQVEGDVASAQASAADLAAATLSAQVELAADYIDLRVLDEQKRLYDDTVAAYQRSLQVTQNQYNAGVVAKADVITAQTQLISAQAQAADIGVQRAQTEHAIAVLAGMAPADLTIAPAPLARAVPTPPIAVPSVVLQRRPDIAAAERRVAAASADIGVQVAAYFPTFNLSGSFGSDAARFGDLFKSANSVWSFGLTAADTLFDFGARRARVREARATYDREVAAYRQTVLNAFQNVEDQLVALRVLEQEATLRDQSLASARQAEQLALNRYRAGQVDYTTVIQAQTTALNSAQSVLTVLRSRQNASVALIEALGGGWSEADLPKR